VRVSTDDQNVDGQKAQLKEYCDRRGWAERVGWFQDAASGTIRNRGALGVMMDEVREGTVDVVLTWKIDRLARSLNHLAQIVAELQTHKVALVCPSQGIDTTEANPCAEFQINILAAVAQFERELIVERVKGGIAAAKQRGIKLGRPATSSRYLEQVRTLFAQGMNASAISRRLGIPYSTAAEKVREYSGGINCSIKTSRSLNENVKH
jgi:DNA invertase Pin-like site-specific DNA recombinase